MSAPSATIFPQSQSWQPEYHAMRGWLILLFLSVAFFVPIQALTYFVSTWLGPRTPLSYPLPNRLVAFGHTLGLFAITVFGIYAGIALLRLQPNAIRIVKFYFLARVVFAVSYLVSLKLFLNVKVWNADDPTSSRSFKLMAELISLSIWAWYLVKSKRVAGTYPPSESTLFK